jgi:beta-lactamase class A
MNHSPLRRAIVFGAAATVSTASWSADMRAGVSAKRRLSELEETSGGRLGVAALDTGNAARLRYRADERFAVCSTFKLIAVGAILKRSMHEGSLLEQRIRYAHEDLATYSPITQRHVGEGLTVSELCAAAVQYSDNTAANLLLKLLGGPPNVTAFARSIGDNEFRLDRWEPQLNTSIPGDLRDTSTPGSMQTSLQRLALGNALGDAQRLQLLIWLKGNTTGANRIRAGVPSGWQVGDKTGSGDFGTTNDVAVLWPEQRRPMLIALYFTQPRKDAKLRDDVLASATRIVVRTLI